MPLVSIASGKTLFCSYWRMAAETGYDVGTSDDYQPYSAFSAENLLLYFS